MPFTPLLRYIYDITLKLADLNRIKESNSVAAILGLLAVSKKCCNLLHRSSIEPDKLIKPKTTFSMDSDGYVNLYIFFYFGFA